MHGTNRKWAALFFFLIALPVGALTYLSVSSFQDEQRAALTQTNLLVPALQQAVDGHLDALAARAREAVVPPAAPGAGYEIPGVEDILLLHSSGALRYPRYLGPALQERSPAFAGLMRQGERHEFHTRDLKAAAAAYGQAFSLSDSSGPGTSIRVDHREKLESLNALGRVAAKQGDLAQMTRWHQELLRWARVGKVGEGFPDYGELLLDYLDPDGAHPASLSYLRLAGRLPPDEALAALDEWLSHILQGEMSLSNGIHHLLDLARERAHAWRHSHPQARAVIDRIDRVRRLADRVATYNGLRETGLLAVDRQTVAGTGADGASFLLRVIPGASGFARAAFIDLELLAAQVMLASAAGVELRNQGFALELFDVDQTARFDLKHRDGTRMVVPASRLTYRLNMGIFAADEAFVLHNYRNRNLFTTLGILLLAGAVAGGAYLLFRDTRRQLHTARLRSDFVANVSHELRTPLTSIRMYAETLRLGRYRDRAQLQDYLDTIMQESQRLSRMVGNVLDFSRMESGRKAYDFAPVDLGQLVRRTLEEFGPLLDEGGFALADDVAAGLPAVRADAEALSSAVANLLSNAVKYSGDRREIAVAVARGDGRQTVAIADRGVGVPPAERERIFDKFHRAPNAGEAATGTGLGLALVKGVVEAHGGAVTHAPRDGGGSIFTLHLPES